MNSNVPFKVVLVVIATIYTFGQAAGKAQHDDVIVLDITRPEPGFYRPYLDIDVDGQRMKFQLDTGARQTSVDCNDLTKKYKVASRSSFGGGFGTVEHFDVIRPHKVQIGSHQINNLSMLRAQPDQKRENLLGLNCFQKIPFKIDFKTCTLTLMSHCPSGINKLPLKKIHSGHILVPIKLGDIDTYALFDTGAVKTCLDFNFVKQHPQMFKFSKSNQGSDSTGKMQETPLYTVDTVTVDNLTVKDLEVATWPFVGNFKEKMEGCPMILGSNFIYKAKWIFDLKHNAWSLALN